MDSRRDFRYRGVFTKVPGDPSQWRRWEAMGRMWVREYCRQNGGRQPAEMICRDGEKIFPRFFQLLAPGGTLIFNGSLDGVHYTFMGKRGFLPFHEVLKKANLCRGESVLVYYGSTRREKVDAVGMDAIESVLNHGGIPVIATMTDEQQQFVTKRWKGLIAGAVSLETLKDTWEGFDWPSAMPYLPDPQRRFQECQEVLNLFQQRTVTPFRKAIFDRIGMEEHPGKGLDMVLERAQQDTLGISLNLVRPSTGRVVYGEEMAGRRYSFYAPQVWMNKRRIIMPTAAIAGEPPQERNRKGKKENASLIMEAEQLVRKLEAVGSA
ncbi:hypothetical protein [Melghirimyces algeriensis]|uniref:Uncharacterized protein n=1 Tax=Melghirimyces algeriensis TaxID=910412 RepID=A0A521AV92_9BACL|nr:hypothetical protein [Melghirimyces algeriensis]SMO38725.1 hypothetical protein SAMN06264849_101366 [Melghirimyces algeriensis]